MSSNASHLLSVAAPANDRKLHQANGWGMHVKRNELGTLTEGATTATTNYDPKVLLHCDGTGIVDLDTPLCLTCLDPCDIGEVLHALNALRNQFLFRAYSSVLMQFSTLARPVGSERTANVAFDYCSGSCYRNRE